jgi:cyclopropane-fatty-acyl-phospholipid synthase
MTVAQLVEQLFGEALPVEVTAYDGSRTGARGGRARVVINSPHALRYLLHAPGELGAARAYVAGHIELHGDLSELSALRHLVPELRVEPRALLALIRLLGVSALRPLAPPPEEFRGHKRRHTVAADRDAVRHHYDLSDRFYRLLLGPTMTYSCGVWNSPGVGLEAAQAAKHELVCRKLALRPGMRLLDVGCGWGGMVMHAARHHGVTAVGITVSPRQAATARRRVAEAGLDDRVEIRLQDYRQVVDEPFDAISSIGMVEHVGSARLEEYAEQLWALLAPQGRLCNHGISQPWRPPGGTPMSRRSFMGRYVFPDSELHEAGSVVTTLQKVGFEARHLESLREHYVLTLRAWLANLEANWDEAVAEVGVRRCRVWRLYIAGAAAGFEDGDLQVHQVLATRSTDGRSGMTLRPRFEGAPTDIDLRGADGTAGSRVRPPTPSVTARDGALVGDGSPTGSRR